MQEHVFQTGLNRSEIFQRETLLLEFKHNGRYQIRRSSEDADHLAAVVDAVSVSTAANEVSRLSVVISSGLALTEARL